MAGPAVAEAHGKHDGARGWHGRSHRTGFVYLDDNTAGTNTIAGFARHADGSLSSLPGSPFAAGGVGLGKGLPSQGAIQVIDNGRFVVAVDAGSNQISVLRIARDGSLRPAEGGPVASGGVEPVSITVHDGLVYVANAGDTAGGSNYTGFTLSHRGRLRPLAGSTVTLPPGSGPGEVLFNGDATKLVGVRVNTSLIDSFTVGWDGRLTAAPGSPYAAQGLGPFGSQFRPTNPNQLFVDNAHNGPQLGTVSAFHDAANGTLSSIGSSPFADQQTAPCWQVISHDGRYLFAMNTGSGEVSSYAIAHDGTLTLLGSVPVSSMAGIGAVDISLSSNGRTLYVNESKTDSVGEFAVHGGNLTELPGSPVPMPAGATPATPAGVTTN